MTVHSSLPYVVFDPEDFLLAEKGDDDDSTIEELIQSYLDFAAKYDFSIQTYCILRDRRPSGAPTQRSLAQRRNPLRKSDPLAR